MMTTALKMEVPLFAPLGWENVRDTLASEVEATTECLAVGAATLPIALGGLVRWDEVERPVEA